ncbi:MAG: 50S ribosomal protein L30 [Acidobacteria bacterium]|nr:50S ribosomal protein L30 [Acidobacteriota bacterium]
MPKKTRAVAGKTVKIEHYRSAIGRPDKQERIVRALGLRRLNQVVERPDTPDIRGMVAKVPHLLRIVG